MAEIIPEKSDVQEVEEPGPDMQKGEGHLKVPHFRTGEMLSLHCGLAGLMVNSILAVVVWDNWWAEPLSRSLPTTAVAEWCNIFSPGKGTWQLH